MPSNLKQFSKVLWSEGADQTQSLARNLEQLELVLKQLTDLDILDGRLIEDQAVVTTTTVIDHKLGRQIRGWIVTDKAVNTKIWRTAWDDKTITLDCQTNCTVSLWVF